jgi:hypothetical protein
MKQCKHLTIPMVLGGTVTNDYPPGYCDLYQHQCHPMNCPDYEPIEEKEEGGEK